MLIKQTCIIGIKMAGNKNFGNHLKKMREAKGFSQEKLAELVGVEYQTISRIETGYYFTNFENLQKISKALDVTIKDLFDFSEEELTKNEIIKQINKKIKILDIKDLKYLKKLINLFLENKK